MHHVEFYHNVHRPFLVIACIASYFPVFNSRNDLGENKRVLGWELSEEGSYVSAMLQA